MTRRPELAQIGSAALLCGLALVSVAATPQDDDTAAFARLDASGNGYLTGTEITDEIRGYDANGDRRILREEFSAGRARDRAAGKTPDIVRPNKPDRRQTAETAPTVKARRPLKLPALAARPGYVIGRAVFADGRPIPRFRVTANGWAGEIHLGQSGTIPNLGGEDARNGKYAIRTTSAFDRKKPIKAMVTSVQASAMLTRDGKEYWLDMHPTDGKPDGSGAGSFRGNSGKGVTRDFVLRLSGPKRGYEKKMPPRDTSTNEMSDPSFGAFYGGTVGVTMPRDAAQTLDGATITATFTPASPLFDGSASKTVVRALTLNKPNVYSAYFRDIPLGDYTVMVAATLPDGTSYPLRLRLPGSEFQESAPVVFEAFSSYGVRPLLFVSER